MPDKPLVLQSEIWNCPNAFDKRCPMEWRELSWTMKRGVRFCKVCQKKVYKVKTPEEFVEHGNAGHCVAVQSDTRPADMVWGFWLGEPSADLLAKEAEAAGAVKRWWAQVVISQPQFNADAMEVVKEELEDKANDVW